MIAYAVRLTRQEGRIRSCVIPISAETQAEWLRKVRRAAELFGRGTTWARVDARTTKLKAVCGPREK